MNLQLINCLRIIRQKHDSLLARPKHIEKKYEPEEYEAFKSKFLKLKRPIFPIKNKRIDMLSVPLKITEKYEEPDLPSTIVPRSALEVVCTPRLDHLSRPTLRFLLATRKDRRYLGKIFLDAINEKIALSFNSIYYHNLKSLKNIEAAKKKAKQQKQPSKKPKGWNEIGDKERLLIISLPKPKPKPRPRKPRKWKPLEQLKPGIEKLSVPNQVYKRPSQDSLILRLRISPAALTYQITERMMELAKVPKHRMYVPYVWPGWVSPGALLYEITDRIKELAEPHTRANAPQMDVKENPYDISPFALKYKPTPRICQLAKPRER